MIYALALFTFVVGLLVGRIIFSNSKPRSLLNFQKCSNRLDSNEIAGLFASVVVQKLPGFIPKVIIETDKTIVFNHPRPKHRIHYIFIPKKDIKNIGELTDDDKEYIIDLFSTVVAIINNQGITNYKLWTNGPEKQDVSYLHFHLGAE
jgi:hypothetical protein